MKNILNIQADMLAAGNIASASRQLGNRKLSEVESEVGKWKKDENLWSIKTKPNKWRTFSISKLGKWFDDMLAARNIATASRQVRNRKLSEIRVGSWEMEKDENLWSIKTKQNKWRIFSISKLGKWFEDMLAARNIASAGRTRRNLADSAEIRNRR